MTGILAAKAPTDTTPEVLAAAYTAAGNDANVAALALWYRKEAELITAPAKWSAQGDYSQDNSLNITAVGNKIRSLEGAVGLLDADSDPDTDTVTSGVLTTRRRGRRGGRRTFTRPTPPPTVPAHVTATRALLDKVAEAIADAA